MSSPNMPSKHTPSPPSTLPGTAKSAHMLTTLMSQFTILKRENTAPPLHDQMPLASQGHSPPDSPENDVAQQVYKRQTQHDSPPEQPVMRRTVTPSDIKDLLARKMVHKPAIVNNNAAKDLDLMMAAAYKAILNSNLSNGKILREDRIRFLLSTGTKVVYRTLLFGPRNLAGSPSSLMTFEEATRDILQFKQDPRPSIKKRWEKANPATLKQRSKVPGGSIATYAIIPIYDEGSDTLCWCSVALRHPRNFAESNMITPTTLDKDPEPIKWWDVPYGTSSLDRAIAERGRPNWKDDTSVRYPPLGLLPDWSIARGNRPSDISFRPSKVMKLFPDWMYAQKRPSSEQPPRPSMPPGLTARQLNLLNCLKTDKLGNNYDDLEPMVGANLLDAIDDDSQFFHSRAVSSASGFGGVTLY